MTPPPHEFRTTTAGPNVGFRVALEPSSDDPITKAILDGFYPDKRMWELVNAALPPGGVMLDLGGHIGYLSLAAAVSGRRVVTVEASPRNAALIAESVRENGLGERMTLIHAAVSDEAGTLEFRSDGPWGQVAVGPTSITTVSVSARTGAEILASLDIAHVDLIKMDVEGSEVRALTGLSDLLSRPDSPPVLYEANQETLEVFGAKATDLFAMMEGFGYRNYLIDSEPRKLRPLAESDHTESFLDVLAVKSRFGPKPGLLSRLLGPRDVTPRVPGWTTES